MIQRIIDWYNGYTLQEKLELELLEEYALFLLLKETAEELNENLERYPIFDKNGTIVRKELIWKPFSGMPYQPVFNSYEYGITNHKIEKLYLDQFWEGSTGNNDKMPYIQRIKLYKKPGSTLRIIMGIRNLYDEDEKHQLCKEYCINDLRKQMIEEEIKSSR